MIKWMKPCASALVISLVSLNPFQLALARQTTSQNPLVEEVVIRGNRNVTREAILKHVKTKPGQRYNRDQAKRDYEAILKMGFFDPLKTRFFEETGPRGGKIITFQVSEYPDGKRRKE
jgi:outer membrane protein assembly factor BamA